MRIQEFQRLQGMISHGWIWNALKITCLMLTHRNIAEIVQVLFKEKLGQVGFCGKVFPVDFNLHLLGG